MGNRGGGNTLKDKREVRSFFVFFFKPHSRKNGKSDSS